MRQVLRAGALGRPRGIGWRGRREGGSEWGTHVNPWLIHVNVWQKPLQYCKVISLQLIKINLKKLKKTFFQNYCVEETWNGRNSYFRTKQCLVILFDNELILNSEECGLTTS